MSAVAEAVSHRPLWLDEVRPRRHEVLNDASLRDLPCKVETNRGGQLITSSLVDVRGGMRGYGREGARAASTFDVDPAAVAFDVSRGDR